MGNKIKKQQTVIQSLDDGSLYEKDLSTLYEYLKIVSNTHIATNPVFKDILDRAARTIQHLIQQKESEVQNKQTLRWAKVAAFAAILSLIVGLFQLLSPHADLEQSSKTSSPKKQSTTNEQKLLNNNRLSQSPPVRKEKPNPALNQTTNSGVESGKVTKKERSR